MIRIMICAMLSIGFLTSCASNQKSQEQALLLLRSGTAYLMKGDHPSAMRDLQNAEKLDPKNAIVQNNLGLAYFVRDKFVDSERHLRRAIELQPTYTDARNNHGRVLIELAQYEAAVGELEKVLNDLTYPEPEKAWFNIGLAYFRRGQFATARDKFTEAIRIKSQHCLAQTFYGRSLLELGDFDRAARTLDGAVGLCKTDQNEEPHYYSGISYYKLGRTDKAVARMEEIIREHPQGRFAKKAESMIQLMMK